MNTIIEQDKCGWVNQKGALCSWRHLKNKLYCKRHGIYEGVYTPNDIHSLTRCSGCKNLFMPAKNSSGTNKKICSKCCKRSSCVQKKATQKRQCMRKKCLGVSKHGSPCRNYALEDDIYCSKHQTYKKWKQLTDLGHKICCHWIRGCFAILADKHSQCKQCRIKYQKQENIRTKHMKQLAVAYNENPVKMNTKQCYVCCKIKQVIEFVNERCLVCYTHYCTSQFNRTQKEPCKVKLQEYKCRAKSKNIEWKISKSHALSLFNTQCYYCNDLCQMNGIDRLDNSKGYVKENVAACCAMCNMMKATHTVAEFIDMIIHLLLMNGHISNVENYNTQSVTLFKPSQHAAYARFILDAKHRDISNTISENKYNSFICRPCCYCKQYFENGCRGIDRISSTMGYDEDNCVSSCGTCNKMKNIHSLDDWFQKMKQIYKFQVLNAYDKKESHREKILRLCKTVHPFQHETFYKKPIAYDNVTICSDIEIIKNMNIVIELCETKAQLDIWNYYRRTVSSLKKRNCSKLVGRQMFILVKDNNTQTYIGIISLSSDTLCLERRDTYIGWSAHHKIKKKHINYLMNMSTCVPLQPFGYNFAGGKLLASLVFSKEVLSQFYKKYNHHLLGVTTTGLYGKSVQYSRLKCLTYVGLTKGNSVCNIDKSVTKACQEYLKTEGYDYPLKKKFIILQKAFDKLQLPKEDFLRAKPKGIYFGFTCNESQLFLQGKINNSSSAINPITTALSAHDICKWWINRWAIQRHTHLQKNERVK